MIEAHPFNQVPDEYKRTADNLKASLEPCPKPCVMCDDRKHHWFPEIDMEVGEPFMVCMHCDAWREYTDED